jgi:hypothetical protein
MVVLHNGYIARYWSIWNDESNYIEFNVPFLKRIHEIRIHISLITEIILSNKYDLINGSKTEVN